MKVCDVQALEQRTRVERCDCLVDVSFARDWRTGRIAYSHVGDSISGLAVG